MGMREFMQRFCVIQIEVDYTGDQESRKTERCVNTETFAEVRIW